MRVAVVEDETQIRAGIRRKLENMDIEVVFDTDNGLRLLEYLDDEKARQPEVLLTDICMPILDGLEMIAFVRQRRPRLPIVVLSGYGNFEYARQAIRLDVHDYLLKPVRLSELQSIMDKIKSMLKEQEQENREKEMTDLADNLAGYISCRGMVPLLAETKQKILQTFPKGFYIKMVLLSNWESHLSWFGRISEGGFTFIYPDRPNLFISLVADKDVAEIRSSLQGTAFTAYYSQKLWDCSAIAHTIRLGIRAMKDHLMLEKQLVLEADEITGDLEDYCALEGERLKHWETYYSAHYEILMKEIEEGNLEEIKRQIRGIMNYPGIPQSRRNQAWLWISWKICEQGSILTGMEDMVWLQEYETLDEFTEGVVEAVSQMLGQALDGESEKTTLDEVVQYVRKNYARDITLKGTSEIFFINRSHLARIFKHKTGTTFNNYLTDLRIEKACELMKQGVSIGKAAELVGYENSRYFSRVFCKVKGCIPSKFKEEGDGDSKQATERKIPT